MEEFKLSSEISPYTQPPFIPDSRAIYYDIEIEESSSWLKKVMNSMRHKWNSDLPSILFDRDTKEEVILLGEVFSNNQESKQDSFKKFLHKLQRIPWVTYRNSFRPLMQKTGKKYTSDSGWGCTIRAGQMMLLVCLSKHFQDKETEQRVELLKLIEENLLSAPFSIHNIITYGGLNKSPGQHFSPSDVCEAMIKIQSNFPITGIVFILCIDYNVNQLEIYSKACEVDENLVRSCRNSLPLYGNAGTSQLYWKRSIYLMIPLMLGVKSIDEKYVKALKFFVGLRFTTGIIVDKTGSALFMVGFSGNKAITLDPHVVKKANKNLVELKSRTQESVSQQVALVDLKELGPSVAVGFYLRDERDLAEFIENIASHDELVQGLIVFGTEKEEDDLFGYGSDEDDFVVLN